MKSYPAIANYLLPFANAASARSNANHAVWIIPESYKYLLGTLNSKLVWLMVSNYCTQIQSGNQLMFSYLGKIPIRTIDLSDPSEDALVYELYGLTEEEIEI